MNLLLGKIKTNTPIYEKISDFENDKDTLFNFDEPNLENMSKTFVGLESIHNRQHNSLFMSSIAKTFVYKLAQTYALLKCFMITK